MQEECNAMAISKFRDTYTPLIPRPPKRKPKTTTTKNKSFTPSTYQQAIFDWIVNGSGDAIVEAVAGSGKSTTLVEAAKLINNSNAIFLAFNKSIASELQAKLGTTMKAITINALGNGMLIGKTTLDNYKYFKLISSFQLEEKSRETLKKLVDLCRYTLTDPTNKESVQELVEHFGLDTNWEVVFPYISEVLDKGISQFNQQGIKDYTDQIWLPQVLRLKPRQYDWIFCDEAQDLSPCQLELILMCRKPNGRIIFVGDPKQAIYGFAGADSKSMEKIEQRTNAIKLPLSICYRCPSSHIELAKTIVPQIEARENAPEGLVAKIDPSQLGSTLEADDLVICRKTAPLVKLCSSLLIKGISAKVKGSDIGKDLISLVRSAQEVEGFKFESFTTYLDKLEHKQIQKLQEKKAPISQLESIKDRIHAIRSAYRASSAKSLEQFCQELEQLFGEAENSVVMCTVHKAKGLEAERVFILEPENLPYLKAGQRDWEVEQENHLKYVALTRAKEELYFVMPESSPFAFPSQPHQNKSENKNDVKNIKEFGKQFITDKKIDVTLAKKEVEGSTEKTEYEGIFEDDENLIEMIQEHILKQYTDEVAQESLIDDDYDYYEEKNK